MFTVTLLTNPETPVLGRALVEALRDAWGGGDARWLDPGVAAEFGVAAVPANFWQVWEDLQALSVDLAVQPAKGRRKRLLIADMDSTMIRQECIDELADEAGVGTQVAAITARAMNGELDFESALIERVSLLQGLPEAVIGRVLADRITLMPGGAALVATMKAAGGYAVLVSGGFTAFAGPIAARLGFDDHRANRLLAEGGVLTGKVALPILGRAAKVEALQEIAARLGISPAAAMASTNPAANAARIRTATSSPAISNTAVPPAEAPRDGPCRDADRHPANSSRA